MKSIILTEQRIYNNHDIFVFSTAAIAELNLPWKQSDNWGNVVSLRYILSLD